MSNSGQLRVVPSVFAAVFKDSKVLLLRRANTGWLDGWYDLPAGHLEDQEYLKHGAVRELLEEVGLTANPKDLKLIHIYQNHHNPKAPHYGYVFYALKWKGRPEIKEPSKCDHMDFFALNRLPKKLSPYVREALQNLNSNEVTISYHAPGSMAVD